MDMIKLTDILNEIKKSISDVKYSYYMIKYDNDKKTYMTSGYLKVLKFLKDNDINNYKLYGRTFNNQTKSSEWKFIEEE